MGYLLPNEYVQYGLSNDTSDSWIAMASSLIESWCRRPSLLPTQYVERMRLTAGSQTARLSYLPLAPIAPATSPLVGIRVRFGKPRRGELPDPFRTEIAWAFSIPGSWSSFDISAVDLNCAIGELAFPENFLGLDYNEVEITYTAGLATIPPAVKTACALIVKSAQAMPSANVKSSRMDTLTMEYFGTSLIDPQAQSLLRPYLAQRIG